jgi:hypothetical protein
MMLRSISKLCVDTDQRAQAAKCHPWDCEHRHCWVTPLGLCVHTAEWCHVDRVYTLLTDSTWTVCRHTAEWHHRDWVLAMLTVSFSLKKPHHLPFHVHQLPTSPALPSFEQPADFTSAVFSCITPSFKRVKLGDEAASQGVKQGRGSVWGALRSSSWREEKQWGKHTGAAVKWECVLEVMWNNLVWKKGGLLVLLVSQGWATLTTATVHVQLNNPLKMQRFYEWTRKQEWTISLSSWETLQI